MTFEEFIGDRVNVLSPQEYHAVEAAWKHQQNHIDRLEWYLTDAKNALKERRQIVEHQRNTIADLTEKLDIERNNKGVNKLNDECLFDTQEEHDRYELEQAIMSCWGITDELRLISKQYAGGDESLITSVSNLYDLKFRNLFEQFEKFTGCC